MAELTIEQLKFAREIGATHMRENWYQGFFRNVRKSGYQYWNQALSCWSEAKSPTKVGMIKIDFSPLDDYKQDKDFDIAATGGEVDVPVKMSDKYPAYFKDFRGNDEADVYLIHHKFGIDDPSGCIHHASKKLLLSGVRTGGKSKYQDVKEARDTLNRWLEINKDAAE